MTTDLTVHEGEVHEGLDAIDASDSKSGIAPNVIHAMDATHLMMTVLRCIDYGVTDIMVVHDSFATTIGGAQRMSQAIREAFVELYDGYCLYSDVLNSAKHVTRTLDNVEVKQIDEISSEMKAETSDDRNAGLREQIDTKRFVVWPTNPRQGGRRRQPAGPERGPRCRLPILLI